MGVDIKTGKNDEENQSKDKLYLALIRELKKVKGAQSYDGEASVQVRLPTTDGKYLRVGITDDDVAPGQGLWFDYYEGLALKSKEEKCSFCTEWHIKNELCCKFKGD